LRVDSPGGGVAASQEIFEAVKKARAAKKVVVSMGSVAASGGYYVSAPANLIVANPGTLTGSIGVLMEFVNVEELMGKIGVGVQTIKSKEHKDIGSPFRPMTDKEKGLLQSVIVDVYDQFVATVSTERGIPYDSVVAMADGRIFTGRMAKELGLVDTLGSFQEAVTITKELSGIAGEPRLVYPKKKRSLIDMFFEPMDRLLLPKIQYKFKTD
jgi:protease-4